MQHKKHEEGRALPGYNYVKKNKLLPCPTTHGLTACY